MATYVADELDEHIALLSGTFTPDEPNKTLTLGSDGEGDTLFTFPITTEWLLIETYDIEDVYGDIGYTVYTDNVSNIQQKIADAVIISNLEYTLYKITATHYKGDYTCDVYSGDESTSSTIHITDITYTPPTDTWKLSTNLVTPVHQTLICSDTYDCSTAWVCDETSTLGRELVTNGTFNVDTSEWVESVAVSDYYSLDGKLNIIVDPTRIGQIHQLITGLEIGKEYLFKYSKYTSLAARISLARDLANQYINGNVDNNGTGDTLFYWTATQSTCYVRFRYMVLGTHIFDNVSIREVL